MNKTNMTSKYQLRLFFFVFCFEKSTHFILSPVMMCGTHCVHRMRLSMDYYSINHLSFVRPFFLVCLHIDIYRAHLNYNQPTVNFEIQ